MAEVELNPAVAKISPNVADALRKSQLPPGSARIVDQYARSWSLGKKLIKMPEDEARKEFLSLEPIVQNNIYSLYSNQEIFAPEKSLGVKILSGVGEVATRAATAVASPLVNAFKLADTWDKTFKTAGSVIQSVRGGKADFSAKVITDSYNGKNMWRADTVKEYEAKYGKALVTLARGLAEQRTPGEAIDLYGKFDEDMVTAIRFMGDNQEDFDKIVLEIKQNAQMSPGRNVANSVISKARMSTPLEMENAKKSPWYKIAKTFGFDISTTKGQQKTSEAISAPLDFLYSVLNPVDPLTYTGFVPAARAARKGIAGGIEVSKTEALKFAGYKSRGEQLVDQYKFIAEKFGETGIKRATRAIFREPDVRTHWDKEIGPLIKEYADAPTPAYKGAAYRKIMQTYPEWANEEAVSTFAKAKVFDADKAEYFFQDFENGRYLLSMEVDGISQTRNGIPVAKSYRETTTKIHKAFYDIFNYTPKTADEFAKIDETAEKVVGILSKTGKDSSLISTELDEIAKISKERSTFLREMGRLASRSPGRILYGDDAIKTIKEVRNLATLVVGKDVAEAVAQLYVKLAPEYQITFVRNLHDAYYRAIGMHGSPNGREHAAELLNKTFNEKAGFLNTVRSEIPQGWETDLERSIFKYENDVPVLRTRGAVQPSQLTEGIAPINFDLALEYASEAKVSFRQLSTLFGGATRNSFVRKFQNFWVTQTLFPRLGNRTTIDEGFMISLQDSYDELLDIARGKVGGTGTAQRDISTMVSGSKAGVGLYKRGLYKLFPTLDLTKKIDAEERARIIQELADSTRGGVSVEELSQAEIMLAVTNRAIELYGKTMPTEVWDSVKLIMKHNPQMIDAMANSLGSRSTLSGNIDVDYMSAMFRQSAWSETLEGFGLKQGPEYTAKLVSSMNNLEVAIAHWDNWNSRFTVNKQSVDTGVVINPVNYFFNNNGLATSKDLTRARNAMLERVGVKYDFNTDTFVAEKPELLKKFIGPYGTTAWLREAGNTDAQIAKAHIESMLIDLKNTFHGTTNAFNKTLFNLIKAKHDTLIANSDNPNIADDAWSMAARSLSFKEFQDATSAHQPVGEINTRLIKVANTEFDMKSFEQFGKYEDIFNRYQNWTMDVMDATVTGLLRQKIVWFKISKNLKELKPFQANIEKDIIENAIKADPYIKVDEKRMAALEKAAANSAEARLANLAYENAISDVISMVDNPNVRSNLAVSVRSVGRFYRATEDFQRRSYRLYTKRPLRALMRLRLLQTGLQAHGDVYTDEKGDQYIIFPTDALINNAVEPVMRLLTGNDMFKVPTFSDLTVKLRLINPSFSPDAGQPALSGPIGAVSMMGVKALLNELPFIPKAWKQEGKDIINEWALGDIGKNLDLYTALMPMFQQSILATLPYDELNRQKASATTSAIAAFQAYGYGLPANATAEQKYKYMRDLKISVHTLLLFRNFAGNISPGQPTLKQTSQLTDAVKRAGISSPKSEFWDIYNSIIRNSNGDLGNTFDLAVMTWIGKNPGKSAWLVPTSEKEYKVFINKTNQVKDWAVKNDKFVDTYKEIAWIFSPRSGDYNPDIYNWMQSEGLISRPDLEKYLLAVQLEEDKINYFNIDKERDEKLKNSNDIVRRSEAIDEATFKKRMMRAANPYLAADVEGNLESQGLLEVRLKTLNEALESPDTPINKMTRTAMRLIVKDIKALQEYSLDVDNRNRFDFSLTKSEIKERIQTQIKEVGAVNPEVNEAARLIFTPLLNMYSKETISAGARD